MIPVCYGRGLAPRGDCFLRISLQTCFPYSRKKYRRLKATMEKQEHSTPRSNPGIFAECYRCDSGKNIARQQGSSIILTGRTSTFALLVNGNSGFRFEMTLARSKSLARIIVTNDRFRRFVIRLHVMLPFRSYPNYGEPSIDKN